MLELVIILAASIPVTSLIVGFCCWKQADIYASSINAQLYEFLSYLEKNQQIGGKPVELVKAELVDQQEERKARVEATRPLKTPNELLR